MKGETSIILFFDVIFLISFFKVLLLDFSLPVRKKDNVVRKVINIENMILS